MVSEQPHSTEGKWSPYFAATSQSRYSFSKWVQLSYAFPHLRSLSRILSWSSHPSHHPCTANCPARSSDKSPRGAPAMNCSEESSHILAWPRWWIATTGFAQGCQLRGRPTDQIYWHPWGDWRRWWYRSHWSDLCCRSPSTLAYTPDYGTFHCSSKDIER